MADATMTLAQVDEVLSKYYRIKPAKRQEARQGDTAKWFNPRGEKMKGSSFFFYAMTQLSTPTRRQDFATAVAGEAPDAQPLSYTRLRVDDDDLTMFQASASINLVADIESSDEKMSVYKLAMMVIGQIEEDFGEARNGAIHQNTAATMGTVAAIYDEDGTSYTSGQADAFIQITDGSISQFHAGMKIDINAAIYATVTDVIYGDDGPWSGGTRVPSIGPGIVVDVRGATTNFDSVTTTMAITRSGETTGDNFPGLPVLFSGTTNMYKDTDGNVLDRDAQGQAWSIPHIYDPSGGSSPVALNLWTHMQKFAIPLAKRIGSGRRLRQRVMNPEEALDLPESLVMVGPPDLIEEAASQAADTAQFATAMATSMGDAERGKLFGQVGFDGVVWRCPTLGTVAFQSDVGARPNKLDLIDPSSLFYLYLGANQEPQWVPNDAGGRWHAVHGASTGKITYQRQAMCWTACRLVCDQPGANAEIQGIKNSNY